MLSTHLIEGEPNDQYAEDSMEVVLHRALLLHSPARWLEAMDDFAEQALGDVERQKGHTPLLVGVVKPSHTSSLNCGDAERDARDDNRAGCKYNSAVSAGDTRAPLNRSRLTEEELEEHVSLEPGVRECAGVPGEQCTSGQEDQEADRAQNCVCDDHLLEGLQGGVDHTARARNRPASERLRKIEAQGAGVKVLLQTRILRAVVGIDCPVGPDNALLGACGALRGGAGGTRVSEMKHSAV